ncbi:MAG: hypothetical protein ABSE63_14770 [Thermoguttaceae bacterium]|jgi:uncharacterized protein YuzE
MHKLAEILPQFVSELESSFSTSGQEDFAVQLKEVNVVRYTYDNSCDAVYIYLESPRPLNVVEENIIGIKHGETIPIEHRYWVNIDTDNFGRLRGIEILIGSDIAKKLSAFIDS